VNLPVVIVAHGPGELAATPVISVDGAAGEPGLNLSHWPGNRTPAHLRHDLSTGSALAFARLPRAEQERLAEGARAISNNHYDTDGTCALFAVRHPEAALARSDALLAAARAGDFYELPSEAAFAVDAIVGGLADPERSPLARERRARDALGRHQLATEHLMEHLGAILDGEREPYRALCEPELAHLREDLALLSSAQRDDVVHLSWTIWTTPPGVPGRHALFGRSAADRVLVVAPAAAGTRYRLVLSTRSWFDLTSRPPLPRPDLAALAQGLNDLEGTDPAGALAWRAEESDGPSPELWFGAAELERFSEHNGALAPSALEPARVRRAVAEALRAVVDTESGPNAPDFLHRT
jgi:hypothetical protein